MTSKGIGTNLSFQRKSLLKKSSHSDLSMADRLSDDEAHRPRRFSNINDLRRTNHQLGILREILFNARDIDKLMQKSNGVVPSARPTRPLLKNPTIKKFHSVGNRPTSAKSVTLSERVQMTEDDSSDRSAERKEITTRVRPAARTSSAHSRPTQNVSFTSNASKVANTDSNKQELKKLLDLLWIELDELESLTGFQSGEKSSSNTCSSALAVALLNLTGHVKECVRLAQNKQDIHTLKEQLAIVIRNQLDFQQKIENQMCTLQTMMQTICQLVNSEIISHRTMTTTNPPAPPTPTRSSYHASKVAVVPSGTNSAMDELLTFAQRMNDGPTKKTTTRPASAISHSESLKPLPLRPPIESESARLSPGENLFQSPKETLLEKILQERLRLVQHMAELTEHTDDLPSSSN